MKPHKHAELIKAWADGAEIEFYDHRTQKWWGQDSPDWTYAEYRIKPEPKPDVVMEEHLFIEERIGFSGGFILLSNSSKKNNLKLTFDGETSELKSAEVLK